MKESSPLTAQSPPRTRPRSVLVFMVASGVTGVFEVAANLITMEQPTPEFARMQHTFDHELREALTLSRGWLQVALRSWRTLGEDEREQMITAALFGTNRVAFLLDVLDGGNEESVTPAPERMADDLHAISRSVLDTPTA